jgi:hypothetical protein
VDPWLRAQLRLAERQGLFQQRHISPVQAYALVILNHLDFIDRAEGDRDAFKRSLIANGGFDHKVLFPEFFLKAPKPVEKIDPESDDFNPKDIVWDSPTENMDEFERVMEAVQRAQSGIVSADDLAQPQWSAWK